MAVDRPRQTILILSQVYVPDPASVGQHMADAAEELVRRGYRVKVLTSRRGYNDPSTTYPASETLRGVEVLRVPFASFGKHSIFLRLLGASLFLIQAIFRGVFTRNLACLLISTSPPMCSVAALVITWMRRVPVKYWVMDLNPDQMIELGKISKNSFLVHLFNWLNRLIFTRADDVIVLDSFMAERVARKIDVLHKLFIMPPWPHEDHLERIPKSANPFVAKHGLNDKFVFMYSGNHSMASPLTTLLQAALRLRDEDGLLFMFIGDGLGKKEVDDVIQEYRPANMISLPYQRLSEIKYSLSAAEVHFVTLGETMVGVNHPCKVYGAMAMARPVLYLGPSPSHISDLIEQHRIGWCIPHGDVDSAVQTIREIAQTNSAELAAMGTRAREIIDGELGKFQLCGDFCDVVENGLQPDSHTRTLPTATREDHDPQPIWKPQEAKDPTAEIPAE